MSVKKHREVSVRRFMIFAMVLVGMAGVSGLYAALLDEDITSSALALGTVFALAVLLGIVRLHDVLEEIRDRLDR